MKPSFELKFSGTKVEKKKDIKKINLFSNFFFIQIIRNDYCNKWYKKCKTYNFEIKLKTIRIK